ncbi:MAG: alpha/beta family hydrolase, partial [Gammaproteobacteria bacterium]
MKTENHSIRVSEKSIISSSWLIPEGYERALIIAHGAGQDMNSPFISALHEGIAKHNILTVKFNFPYLEQGRKVPDRPSVLMATWHAVINAVKTRTDLSYEHIILSGKSMGGRYASLL